MPPQSLDCPECNEPESGKLTGSGKLSDPWVYECWACDFRFYRDYTEAPNDVHS